MASSLNSPCNVAQHPVKTWSTCSCKSGFFWTFLTIEISELKNIDQLTWAVSSFPGPATGLLSVCVFTIAEICVISELEDLSASVDVQDVYTKIKCKVGSFNIDHYKTR